MTRSEVPQWIIDCVVEMFDCEEENIDDMFQSDDFRQQVEIITKHYLHLIHGTWSEVNL